jgi:hypothetical protein
MHTTLFNPPTALIMVASRQVLASVVVVKQNDAVSFRVIDLTWQFAKLGLLFTSAIDAQPGRQEAFNITALSASPRSGYLFCDRRNLSVGQGTFHVLSGDPAEARLSIFFHRHDAVVICRVNHRHENRQRLVRGSWLKYRPPVSRVLVSASLGSDRIYAPDCQNCQRFMQACYRSDWLQRR